MSVAIEHLFNKNAMHK